MKSLINSEKIFYGLLGIATAIIPMPGNSLSSISMILLVVCWLFFTTSLAQKAIELKENSRYLLVMTIPLLLAVVGLIYTDNLSYGLVKLQLLLPFLVFPLILFSIKHPKNTYRFVLYCFSFGTFMAAAIGVGRAFYYRLNSLGDYFYYARFSELVDKHTTYFSLFIVISCLFIISELIKSKLKWMVGLIALTFFFFVLYVTSARISIVALILGIIILILTEVKSQYKWLSIILPLLLIGFYSLPNFQKRFEPSETEKGEVHDFEFRKDHWKSVLETIEYNPILIGKGTGGDRDFLYDTYKKYQLTSAYELEYNAHNQYLEFTLDFGLIGLLCFVLMLSYLSYSFIKTKNTLAFTILAVFMVYFLTESLFQRHDGVVVFSLIISLLLARGKKDSSIKNTFDNIK